MILLLGHNGMLGSEFRSYFDGNAIDYKVIERAYVDLTDFEQVLSLELDQYEIIINCIAYTNVLEAENNKVKCYNSNSLIPYNISRAISNFETKLIHFSTESVFGSDTEDEYFEFDSKFPINTYAKTKSVGEDFIITNMNNYFILRLGWLFGSYGNNFLELMYSLSKSHNSLNVVNDCIGNPTYAKDVVDFVSRLMFTKKFGVYHVTNKGAISRYEFARFFLECVNPDCIVNPVLSNHYPTSLSRAKNMSLGTVSITANQLSELPDWKNAVHRYIEDRK